MAHSKQLRVGDAAPDFTLPAADGKMISLSDFRGQSEVVLFFYQAA
jgi:peroxiredoxin Q/BCP